MPMPMPMPVSATSGPLFKIALALEITAVGIMLLNFFFFAGSHSMSRSNVYSIALSLAFAQFVVAAASAICGLVRHLGTKGLPGREFTLGLAVCAVLTGLGAVGGGVFLLGFMFVIG